MVRNVIRNPNHRGRAVGRRTMMTPDGGGKLLGEAPAAYEDPADEGVVTAALRAFTVDSAFGSQLLVGDQRRIGRVEPVEGQPPDVVKKSGERDLVSALRVGELADPLSCVARCKRVAAEFVGRLLPSGGALKKPIGIEPLDGFPYPRRAEAANSLGHAADIRLGCVARGSNYRNRQRRVRLHRGNDLLFARWLSPGQRAQVGSRVLECRQASNRSEGRGKSPAPRRLAGEPPASAT